MKNGIIEGVFFAVLLASGSTFAQENYAQWTGEKRFYLNTSASGANVPATVTGFPVLVRLEAADSAVFTVAKAGGADVRFTKSNGVRLPHQIERWDAVARVAEIWVRLDTLKGSNASQFVRMYWGKADAADSSRPEAVFDTASGFVAVWHMQGSGNALDATANALTALGPTDSVPVVGSGQIGLGRAFNGSAQHFDVPHNERLNVTPQITLSAWVYAQNWTGSARILQKGLGTNSNAAQYGFRDNSSNNFAIEINGTHAATAPDPATGVWNLIHGTYDGATITHYQNGGSVATSSAVSGPIVTGTEELNIGRSPVAATPNFFNGTLDEVRIQRVARGADWIRLEYENQKPGQTLVQRNIPVSVRGEGRGGVPSILAARAVAGGFVFSFPAGAGSSRVQVADVSGRVVWSGLVAPGAREAVWDVRGAANGVYRVRLTGSAGSAELPVVLNR